MIDMQLLAINYINYIWLITFDNNSNYTQNIY